MPHTMMSNHESETMLGIGKIARKVFGTPNDRKIKATRPLVEKINALEPEFEALDDAGLKAKTDEFRKRIEGGESLDEILPEAFANCREAARRALGLRAFDVQLMGGIFLHQGNISEMKTGEGKTLVATFPAYLNALSGKGVHVVTVNDYLARRDAEWMGKVFAMLGMTTGVVYPRQPEDEKKAAYACDITYATNNELGFDYLRDNMKSELNQMYQRDHNFAIVDEVDFDPDRRGAHAAHHLGPVAGPLGALRQDQQADPGTDRGSFHDRRKDPQRHLYRRGQRVPRGAAAGTWPAARGPVALRSRKHDGRAPRQPGVCAPTSCSRKDKDYIVRDDEVVLIDEFTGRMMAGRRLSDRSAPGDRGQGRRRTSSRRT